MKISPKYSKSDWKNLNLEDNNTKDWVKAIEIFDDRINGRFLEQIKILEENPNKKIREFSGFTTMAIDCLLIETLQQFNDGKPETPPRKAKDYFYNFFKQSKELNTFFTDKTKSDIFYNQIRCGILHQAQTKNKSIIRTGKNLPVLSWVNPSNNEEGLVINRKKFHKIIKDIYKKYLKELKNNKKIRENFKKKMNFIIN